MLFYKVANNNGGNHVSVEAIVSLIFFSPSVTEVKLQALNKAQRVFIVLDHLIELLPESFSGSLSL